jgi:hypothetical protein
MKLSKTIGVAALAVALAAGLATAPVAAVGSPAPSVTFKPSQLPVGSAPRAAWLNRLDGTLNQPGQDPITLNGDKAIAGNLFQARSGWMVAYSWKSFWASHVRPDGRIDRQARGVVEIVSADGRSYLTSDQQYNSSTDTFSLLVRQLRVSDGRELARHRFPLPGSGDISFVQMASGRVLLERSESLGRGGSKGIRYTTMWWTPRTGKVSVLWCRTRLDREEVTQPASTVAGRLIAVREGRTGQSIRDLRTRRPLWRLPAGELAASFSPNGKVLVTVTRGKGANEVRELRARDARTGRLKSTFRATLEAPFVQAWESSSVFVVYAGDRMKADNDALIGPALVRCSLGTVACERVDAPTSALYAERRGTSTGL